MGPTRWSRLATLEHPLSSVVNAPVGAGIRIERLNEFPFNLYDSLSKISNEPAPSIATRLMGALPAAVLLTAVNSRSALPGSVTGFESNRRSGSRDKACQVGLALRERVVRPSL